MNNQSLKISHRLYPEYKQPTTRLVVLASCLEADLTLLTRRIWELAASTHSRIKFIGLYDDPTQELALRRTLVTLCAMLNYDDVSSEQEVVSGKGWINTVKSYLQPEDMIVCLEEQRTGSFQRPLSQVLQSDLDVPIYIISGADTEVKSSSNWLAGVGAWIGFVSIILGFFALQINIYHLAKNWTTTLLLLSTVAEFWLIGVWHSISHKL